MFKFRAIGFVLLMGILGGIFFWDAGGVWIFLAVAPALVGAAVGECCSMMERSGRGAFPIPAGIASWLIALGWMMVSIKESVAAFVLLFSGLMIIAGCALLLTLKAQLMQKVFNTAGIMILFLPSLTMFLAAYVVAPRGYWLLFLALVTKATDTGGYIVGTLTAKLPGGNHKIAPRVSPKKSWEGLFGGMLLSLAAAWAFYYFSDSGLSPVWYLISGVVLSLGSFFGDLTESAIKRLCEIKDSGSFVPGMGGAFDVLDSFIYNGILFWVLFAFRF